MRDVKRETITGTVSWFNILPLNLIRAKQRLHMGQKELCQISWSRSHKRKVIHSDNSLDFGKSCGDLACNHRTSTPHRSETSGIAESPFDEYKKVLQQHCHNQDWMKDGGLILWNGIAICEMSKTSWLTGKLRMKDDLENRSRDQ